MFFAAGYKAVRLTWALYSLVATACSGFIAVSAIEDNNQADHKLCCTAVLKTITIYLTRLDRSLARVDRSLAVLICLA